MEWDKDDDDALDFATSAANLRASVFSIPLKTRFDVKQMAGNIIPAIATTNAIIAGAIIMQALQALRRNWTSAKSVWFGRTPDRALNSTACVKPSPACTTCRTPYILLKVEPASFTLGTLVEEVLKEWLSADWDMSISEGNKILYDPDFEDNLEKTIGELGLAAGIHLQVNDEDGLKMPIIFIISRYVQNAPPAAVQAKLWFE
jgi:ubiquitin-like 1-activating enzyme E1 B